MNVIYQHTEGEHEVNVNLDGSIDILLSGWHISMAHHIDRKYAKEIYNALKTVFDKEDDASSLEGCSPYEWYVFSTSLATKWLMLGNTWLLSERGMSLAENFGM